ncbi:hypothetical protein PR048_032588 [Dryococelus australis]|uniref:Uncharacterized protein n=1 Tax=Dryococelus australis TaxID=614101 RepID=A0ABQ9G5K6_9NEOP|nr:hypothetical protein PR048_032588 [Dryococelus australis]
MGWRNILEVELSQQGFRKFVKANSQQSVVLYTQLHSARDFVLYSLLHRTMLPRRPLALFKEVRTSEAYKPGSARGDRDMRMYSLGFRKVVTAKSVRRECGVVESVSAGQVVIACSLASRRTALRALWTGGWDSAPGHLLKSHKLTKHDDNCGGRGIVVVRLLASGVSHVGVVPDDAAGRRVFSAISRFPPPLHSCAASLSPRFTLVSQDLAVKSDSHPLSWIYEIFAILWKCSFMAGGNLHLRAAQISSLAHRNSVRQFRALRVASMAHLMHVAVSPLLLPRLSASKRTNHLQVGDVLTMAI